MTLIHKLLKNTTIKDTDILEDSKLFNNKDFITTAIPAINIACSGTLDGGLTPGLTVIAGPSKHFKSNILLIMARAYLDKYPDAVMLFYDSEFGSPQSYFKSHGIDPGRVVHTPITDIEELTFDIAAQLDKIERGDKVFIAVDSIGNLASKKEATSALTQNSAADMTRAKSLKSVFRIITPHLTKKDIPMVAINHTYQTQEIYSKAVVSGGTGIYYSSSNIWIMGRQQEKDGTDVVGYNFIINVEKSRYLKEKSKIPLVVTYEGGINKFGGLIDLALESGHVIKPKNGWYQWVDLETGEVSEKSYRLKDTMTSQFWDPILAKKSFQDFVRNKYQLPFELMQREDNVAEIMEELEGDE